MNRTISRVLPIAVCVLLMGVLVLAGLPDLTHRWFIKSKTYLASNEAKLLLIGATMCVRDGGEVSNLVGFTTARLAPVLSGDIIYVESNGDERVGGKRDPWDNRYLITLESPSNTVLSVRSFGPNGIRDEDDIVQSMALAEPVRAPCP